MTYLGEHPDHRIDIRLGYADNSASCTCGWKTTGARGDARAVETAAGKHFTQTRLKRIVSTNQPLAPVQRDMPGGLSDPERLAYRKGWNRGAAKFVKDNGLPCQRLTEGTTLADVTTAHSAEREPVAHKAGMSELNSYRRKRGHRRPEDACGPSSYGADPLPQLRDVAGRCGVSGLVEGITAPYAVHYTRRTAGGSLRSMPPTRNLDAEAAEKHLAFVLEQDGVVEAHISLDTCG